MRQGILKEHYFITPLLCVEKETVLEILPADDNLIMGVPHLVCRILHSPLIVLIPVDKVQTSEPA